VPTIVTAPTLAFRDVTPPAGGVASRLIVFATGEVITTDAPAEVKVIAGPVWEFILVIAGGGAGAADHTQVVSPTAVRSCPAVPYADAPAPTLRADEPKIVSLADAVTSKSPDDAWRSALLANATPASKQIEFVPVALDTLEPTLPPKSVTIRLGDPAKVPRGLLYWMLFTTPPGVPPPEPLAAAVTRPKPSTLMFAFV
jgi:hypothetical protein